MNSFRAWISAAAFVAVSRDTRLGSLRTSLSECLWPEELWHARNLLLLSMRTLRPCLAAFSCMYLRKPSFTNPGDATSTALTMLKSMCCTIALITPSWKLLSAFSLPIAAAPCFLGMLFSILAIVSVMLGVMRHTCASPSCITTAARSALAAVLHADSISSLAMLSHPGFAISNLRFRSSSSVWEAPILTCSFSTTFTPFNLSTGCWASKSIVSIRMVMLIFFFSVLTLPVLVSSLTFRRVIDLTVSPTARRL
mmetsp:Transcript_29629/g.69229  ORF Transcript_29629/g.69229 Transcript_29629/m.69229 type:complete len:253 (-) Transcript_29629:267-1025(-)